MAENSEGGGELILQQQFGACNARVSGAGGEAMSTQHASATNPSARQLSGRLAVKPNATRLKSSAAETNFLNDPTFILWLDILDYFYRLAQHKFQINRMSPKKQEKTGSVGCDTKEKRPTATTGWHGLWYASAAKHTVGGSCRDRAPLAKLDRHEL